MHKIEAHIDTFLGNDPWVRYFVACSGGVDSMVLLHILHKLGKRVSAVHVNYLLRGEDSELDQNLVETVCHEKSIPCHVKRVDLNRYLDELGGNLQEQARKVRYSYFETFKLKSDHRVVLGQHADDQVETFFLNLARGSGIMGLSCMLPVRKGYYRPLLPFTKEEVIAYAKQAGVTWREDASNASSKYARNKLRNVLLPGLKKEIPDLHTSVLTLIESFQETQRELESQMKPHAASIEAMGELPFDVFDRLNIFECAELLRQLDIPSGIVNELEKMRLSDKGKRIDLECEEFKHITREYDHFYFSKQNESIILPSIQSERVDTLPKTFSKDVLYLDPTKIIGELRLRTWRVGDRIRPVGLKGSKLISDVLTDAKIPHRARTFQLVLHDDEKILWCVGHAVGRDALATEGSEKVKITIFVS